MNTTELSKRACHTYAMAFSHAFLSSPACLYNIFIQSNQQHISCNKILVFLYRCNISGIRLFSPKFAKCYFNFQGSKKLAALLTKSRLWLKGLVPKSQNKFKKKKKKDQFVQSENNPSFVSVNTVCFVATMVNTIICIKILLYQYNQPR